MHGRHCHRTVRVSEAKSLRRSSPSPPPILVLSGLERCLALKGDIVQPPPEQVTVPRVMDRSAVTDPILLGCSRCILELSTRPGWLARSVKWRGARRGEGDILRVSPAPPPCSSRWSRFALQASVRSFPLSSLPLPSFSPSPLSPVSPREPYLCSISLEHLADFATRSHFILVALVLALVGLQRRRDQARNDRFLPWRVLNHIQASRPRSSR